MGIRVSDEDVFIIHGYGDKDNLPIFLRMDEDGKYNWQKHRACASEWTQAETKQMISEAKARGISTFAIRVL